jgi:hypothetical protein
MKKINYLLFLFLLAACSKEDQISPETTSQPTANATASKVKIQRPFEITLYSTADVNSTNAPTACSGDIPGFAIADQLLHGTASQIGTIASLSTLHHVGCNLSFATALLTTSVTGQITAANGDVIYYSGNDDINVYNLLTGAGSTGTIAGVWTITGGTGRFTGATGSFTINGPVDFSTSTFSGTGTGVISY